MGRFSRIFKEYKIGTFARNGLTSHAVEILESKKHKNFIFLAASVHVYGNLSKKEWKISILLVFGLLSVALISYHHSNFFETKYLF